MRWCALGLACALFAACDSSTPTLTTSPPGATSSSIVDDTCERLVDDAARYLEVVVEVLDDTRLQDFRHRQGWPEALLALEEQGRALDSRSQAMRCDPADTRQRVFTRARLTPDSRLTLFLLELLGLE